MNQSLIGPSGGMQLQVLEGKKKPLAIPDLLLHWTILACLQIINVKKAKRVWPQLICLTANMPLK